MNESSPEANPTGHWQWGDPIPTPPPLWSPPPAPPSGPPTGPTETIPSGRPMPRRWLAAAAAASLFAAAAAFGAGMETVFARSSNRATALSPTFTVPGSTTPTSPSGTVPSGAVATGGVTTGVVDVMTTLSYEQANAAGTGIVLTSSGYVLTNNHVVQGATSVRVQIGGSGPTYTATVVGTDKTDDVAVIKVSGAPSMAIANLGSASSLSVGDPVTAVGNALGQGQLTVVTGAIQALNQEITASDSGGANAEQLSGLIQTSAPLQPGDSGGPLLNSKNQVVGMDTAASSGFRFQSAANVAFAIPIDKALTIAHQIQSGRASSNVVIGLPAFLGVSSIDVSEAAASGRFNPPVSSGAVVGGAASGTPAASAGLVAGDVIVSVDGTAVTGASQLGTLIQSHRAGDTVRIGYVDASGQHDTVTVTLIAGPAA